MSVGVDIICQGLLEECENIIKLSTRHNDRLRRRWWIKPWVTRRENLGASSSILEEWAAEDPEAYRNHLRMSEDQFGYLLEKVTPFIQKTDTWFRDALSAKIKLQMTLRYLATGDNFATLSALYRVPKSTFSLFLPEVCEAIYKGLEEFIMVSKIYVIKFINKLALLTIGK